MLRILDILVVHAAVPSRCQRIGHARQQAVYRERFLDVLVRSAPSRQTQKLTLRISGHEQRIQFRPYRLHLPRQLRAIHAPA